MPLGLVQREHPVQRMPAQAVMQPSAPNMPGLVLTVPSAGLLSSTVIVVLQQRFTLAGCFHPEPALKQKFSFLFILLAEILVFISFSFF